MGKKKGNIWFVIFALILIVFVGAMKWRDNRVINKVIVKGNNAIQTEAIIKLAGVKVGEKISDLNLTQIRSNVEKHKFVKYVDVYTNLPGFLFIEVVERKPIAMVTYAGKIYYVDSEGFIIPSEEIGRIFSVPLLSGVNYKPSNMIPDSNEHLKREFELIKLAIKTKTYDLISEVRVKNDELTFITTEGTVPVFLGKDGFEKKLIVLRKFWEQHVLERGFPLYIDLRYDGKLYAKFNSKN